MRSDPQLRMLEIMLRATLGRESAPDVSARVVGEALTWRRKRFALRAAAACLLLGIGLIVWRGTDPAQAPQPEPPDGEAPRGPAVALLVQRMRVSEADVDLSLPDAYERILDGKRAATALRAALWQGTVTWDDLRPHLVDLPTSDARSDVRRRMLDLLALDRAPASRDLVLGALRSDPRALSIDGMLALADEDGEPYVASLVTKQLEGARHMGQILPAAWHGLRRLEPGTEILRWVVSEVRFSSGMPHLYYAAAAALRHRDPNAWRALLDDVETLVEQYLDALERQPELLEAAAALVLRAQYFERHHRRGRPAALSWLPERLTAFANQEGAALTTPASIRAALAALR